MPAVCALMQLPFAFLPSSGPSPPGTKSPPTPALHSSITSALINLKVLRCCLHGGSCLQTWGQALEGAQGGLGWQLHKGSLMGCWSSRKSPGMRAHFRGNSESENITSPNWEATSPREPSPSPQGVPAGPQVWAGLQLTGQLPSASFQATALLGVTGVSVPLTWPGSHCPSPGQGLRATHLFFAGTFHTFLPRQGRVPGLRLGQVCWAWSSP